MSDLNSEENVTKIVIMGLDNCGKTSILLSLQKKTNILSYFSLKPTQGLNILKLQSEGKDFSVWELGGQVKYRAEYLKDVEKYTLGADRILFVIDVQDVQRYQLALQYLEAMISQLIKTKDRPEISVFLHKFDPGLEEIESFTSEMLSSRLLNRINTIIPSDFEFHIFKTTIFTIFQKTLLQ